MYAADHLIADQLRALAEAEPATRRFLRIRAVLLAVRGRSAIRIADTLGCSRRSAQG
jgi:hypothetical protein